MNPARKRRITAEQSIAEAERDRALDALQAVMHTLRSVGAAPDEHRIYDHARAVLAEHGRGVVDESYVIATREWEARRR